MEFSGQYLNYEEYNSLGGTLDLAPFNLLEFEARKEIDKYTFGRLINLEEQKDEVKLCVYNLINTLEGYNQDTGRNKNISSESTDGYNVSYGTNTTETTKAKQSEIKSIINTYLSNLALEDETPYLYRGTKW